MENCKRILKNLLLIFCLLILKGSNLNAQTTYSKIFTPPNINAFGTLDAGCELISKRVAALGTFEDGGTGINLALYISDSAGNTISSTVFTSSVSGSHDNAAVCQTQDGGFVYGGGVYITGSLKNNLIVKFDSAGAVQWSTMLSSGCITALSSIKELSNGNILTVGINMSSFCNATTGFFLSLLSPSGSLLYSTFYSTDTTGLVAKDIMEAPDGTIYISGGLDIQCIGGVVLMKFSNTLQPLWSKSYTDTLPGVNNSANYQFLDQNLIYLDGYFYIGFKYARTVTSGYDIDFALIKVDTAGQYIWGRDYVGAEQEELIGILPGIDEKINLVAQLLPTTTVNFMTNVLMQIDTAGFLLNSGTLSSSLGSLQPTSFFQSSGGSSYISGVYHTNRYMVYMIKTDSIFSIDCNTQHLPYIDTMINMIIADFELDSFPGLMASPVLLNPSPWLMTETDFCSTISVREFGNNAELLISPNPANSESIYIDFGNTFYDNARISIYETEGKLIISKKINSATGQIKINIAGLSNGIYFTEVKSGNKLFQKKFAVLH